MGGVQCQPTGAQDPQLIRHDNTTIIGYKGFKKGLICINFQYEVGQTYHLPRESLEMCQTGFHFCRFPSDVFKYYPEGGGEDNVYARVKAEDLILEAEEKCATCTITILEILTASALLKEMPQKIVRVDGAVEHYIEGKLHCDDGPAIEGPGDRKVYAQKGLYHRTGGLPADTHGNYQGWYQNGVLHREDGPAVINGLYDEQYWVQGHPHRLIGPAFVFEDGTMEYWINGKRHRENGLPAVVNDNTGHYEYWVNGDPHREGGLPAVVNPPEGIVEYWVHGQRHREDGPARIAPDVTLWCYHDQLHRIGGPAFETPSLKMWMKHGSLHCEDGPAFIKTAECPFKDFEGVPGIVCMSSKVIQEHQSEEYYLDGIQVLPNVIHQQRLDPILPTTITCY